MCESYQRTISFPWLCTRRPPCRVLYWLDCVACDEGCEFVVVVIYDVCGGEVICDDGTCMRGHIFVAPRCAIERGYCVFRWMGKNINKALFVLTTKFSGKGEVPRTIKWQLHRVSSSQYNWMMRIRCFFLESVGS